MKQVPLLIKPTRQVPNERIKTVPWKRSAPFLVNPNAVLVHRVRFASSHVHYDGHHHDSATYWCGNFGRGEFTDDPPVSRLLCARCEAIAVAHGEPSADELAGRHVCTGGVRAFVRCKCTAESEPASEDNQEF